MTQTNKQQENTAEKKFPFIYLFIFAEIHSFVRTGHRKEIDLCQMKKRKRKWRCMLKFPKHMK